MIAPTRDLDPAHLGPVGRFRLVPDGARSVVGFVGDIDAGLSDAFERLRDLVRRSGRSVDVDLGGVSFFGAAGIGFFHDVVRAAPNDDVRLLASSSSVEDVMGLCELPTDPSAIRLTRA